MTTRHEILVELRVTDDESYDRYRAAMTPLLEARGGFFRVDYRVGETLKSEHGEVNRVFIISFPDAATKDAFFRDAAYLEARSEHFEPAVAGGGILAAYDVEPVPVPRTGSDRTGSLPMTADATIHTWDELEPDHPMPLLDRMLIRGDHAMLAHVTLHRGFTIDPHQHPNEQFAVVLSGRVRFTLGEPGSERTEELVGGQVLRVPGNVRHGAEALETTVILDVFSPPSEKTGVDQG